jgi:hypothetical protein
MADLDGTDYSDGTRDHEPDSYSGTSDSEHEDRPTRKRVAFDTTTVLSEEESEEEPLQHPHNTRNRQPARQSKTQPKGKGTRPDTQTKRQKYQRSTIRQNGRNESWPVLNISDAWDSDSSKTMTIDSLVLPARNILLHRATIEDCARSKEQYTREASHRKSNNNAPEHEYILQ